MLTFLQGQIGPGKRHDLRGVTAKIISIYSAGRAGVGKKEEELATECNVM
jgi:hypothetical protein